MTQYKKEMEKDKDLLLEKMLDPDATLTDAELEVILADEELREVHEVSAAVRGAVLQPTQIDVEQEWRLFRHKLRPKPSPWRWMMRVAAIFLGVLFVSAVVKVAIDRLLTDDKPGVVAESKSPAVNEVGETSDNKKERMAEQIPIVEEASEAPVRKVRHKKSVPVLVEAEEEDIDIDEYLRLQQARIDNELALLQARLYIEELQALDISLPVGGEYEESEHQEVRYIIMQ